MQQICTGWLFGDEITDNALVMRKHLFIRATELDSQMTTTTNFMTKY